MKEQEFIKKIEEMIDPIDVGTIHFIQSYVKLISPNLQYKMISSGAKKNPYMGLVVEPYSFFLCYELKDLDWAKELIPDHFKLVKTKIFKEDEPKYYCIFGTFNVHTSAFWGTRMEFYVIAENEETGLLSWIIVAYDTNTVSFDRKDGLSESSTKTCVLTTNYNDEIIIDIRHKKDEKRQLILNGCLADGESIVLDSRLWLEGNLSVAYGRDISKNKKDTFAVIFNPKEVERALKIPLEDVNIEANTWYAGLFEDTPAHIVCFPFAQHYLSDSPGYFSNIRNEEELKSRMEALDFNQISRYSSSAIRKAFKVGQVVSIILIVVLLVLLLVK